MDDATLSHSSHRPPGVVSYNVTLQQHHSPPGAHDGKSGDKIQEPFGGKQINQSDERNQFHNNNHWNGTIGKFPYKVYVMSEGEVSQNRLQKESTFPFREFDRLDTLLNLSVIHRKRALDISRYLIDIGKATIETGFRMIQIHGEKQYQRDRNAVKIGRRLISAGERILSRGEKVLKAVTHSNGRKPSTLRKSQVPTTRVPDIQVVTPVIKMISLCSHGPSHYGVTLLGGIRAGNFLGHGKVDNMQACIKKCCENHECDLAFMVKEDCYSVVCYHTNLCRSVRARHIRKYQPRIARIWRGSSEEKQSASSHAKSRPTLVHKAHGHAKTRLKSRNQRISEDKLMAADYHDKSLAGDVSTNPMPSASRKVTESAQKLQFHPQQQNVPNERTHIKVDESYFPAATSFSKKKSDGTTTVPQKHGESKSRVSARHQTTLKEKDLQHSDTKSTNAALWSNSVTSPGPKSSVHKHPGLRENHRKCSQSAVEHNVGLRHGLKTGKFTYIGELSDIKACLQICCDDAYCDIAFMLDQSCYTVTCASESVCHSIPYHQHKYTTNVVFVNKHFNKPIYSGSISQPSPRNKVIVGKNVSEKKPVLQTSLTKTMAAHKVVSPTLTTVSSIKRISHSFTMAIATLGNWDLGLKQQRPNTIAHAQSNLLETVSFNKSGNELDHHGNMSSKQNSSQLWKTEDIRIKFNGGKEFTFKGKEHAHLESINNASIGGQWQHKKILVRLGNENNLKDRFSSNEKVDINLVGKGKEKEQNKEIENNLQSSLHDTPQETLKSYIDTTTGNHMSGRKFPTSNAVPSTSSFNNSYFDHKQSDGIVVERENQEGGSKRTEFYKKRPVKVKVNFRGKNGLLHGEPDYYKPLPGNGVLPSEVSGSVGEEDESISGESGVSDSTTLRIKVPLSDEGNLTRGESIYHEAVSSTAISKNNSETYMQFDDEIVSTESDVNSSAPSGSGIENDTSQATDSSNRTYDEEAQNVTENCSTTHTYYNATLRGGLKAGNFTFFGIVTSKDVCVTRCCVTQGCDLTFIVLNRCFLVDCNDDDLCDSITARNAAKFQPMITYVNLTITNALQAKSSRNIRPSKETFAWNGSHFNSNQRPKGKGEHRKNVTEYSNSPTKDQQGRFHKSACIFSNSFLNVSFRLGRQAGVFTYQGPAKTIRECAEHCCQSQHCDVVFMVSQDCFFVRCHSNKTCQALKIHGSKFNTRMIFVEHHVQLEEKPTHSTKDALVTPSSSQWNMNTSSSTTVHYVTQSWNYNEPMSSSTAFISLEPQGNYSSSPGMTPTKASLVNKRTSVATITVHKYSEPEQARNFSEVNSSDFVEVKTNGSEFWWQYYLPNVKHSTNSTFKIISPQANDDTNDSTLSLADDSSIRFETPSVEAKTSVSETISGSNTEPEVEEHIPNDSPPDFVEVKTNGSEYWWQTFRPDNKQLRMTNFKAALPDAVEDDSYSDSSWSTSSQGLDISSMAPGDRDNSRHQSKREREICKYAEVVNGVTLKGGYYAGLFTPQDNVTSMEECVSACCHLPKCNLAFMVAEICYTVQCFSKEKCATVKAHFATKYHPRVAYISPFEDKPMEPFNAILKATDAISNSLRCVPDDISAPKYKVQDGFITVHSAARDLGDCVKLCCQTEGCDVALEENSSCYSLNCHGDLKCPEIYLPNSSRSVGVIKDSIQGENLSERLASKACDFSQVLHEVVLRGGSQSGKFKYLVEVEDMEDCIKECCKHKVCDVALMLKDNCFLVSCHNEMLCDAIPSRSSEYHPQLAYKIKHGKRRTLGKECCV